MIYPKTDQSNRSKLIKMLMHKSQDSPLAKVWLNYIHILMKQNNLIKLDIAFNELEEKIFELDKYNLSTDNILFLTVCGQSLREIHY